MGKEGEAYGTDRIDFFNPWRSYWRSQTRHRDRKAYCKQKKNQPPRRQSGRLILFEFD